MRRESDEEAKGQIDYMLLAGLSSPAPTTILGHVGGENDRFKRGKNFAHFHSVVINRTEGTRAPESMLGERISAQPFKPFDQRLCEFLDIGKERVVVGGQGSFYDGFIIAPQSLDGTAQPGSRLSV